MAKRPAASTSKQDRPESFEQALAELESITAQMERGEVPLDESLRLYERGTFLLTHCQQRLDAAEKQISELGRGEGGRLAQRPLRGVEDDDGDDAEDAGD